MGTALRVAAAAAAPTARALPRFPILAAPLAVVAVLPLAARPDGAWYLRLLAVALAALAALALPDPAASQLAAAPTRPAVRLALRVALAALPAAAGWTLVLVISRPADAGSLTAEASLLLLAALAAAAHAPRLVARAPADLVGVAAPLIVFGVGAALPEPLRVFGVPGDHDAGLAVGIAASAFVLLLAGRDEGVRHRRGRSRH